MVEEKRRIRNLPFRQPLIWILVGIFAAEVIAMHLVKLFETDYWLTILIDAFATTGMMFPIVYFFSHRPMAEQINKLAKAEKELTENYSALLVETAERKRAETIMQLRLHLMQYADSHSLEELLRAMLGEIEKLTQSNISFFHFVLADQKTIWLQAWSKNTIENMCKATGKGSHYPLDEAGVWADCAREGKAIVYNDYKTLSNRKGMPDGHAEVTRLMAIPIFRNGKIAAILGMGNKPEEYIQSEVDLVVTLADFLWDIVERKRAEIALRDSEDKFRTLVDWTFDWEMWISPTGGIIYSSPSCERISGYRPHEFLSDPDLLTRIVHPADKETYADHFEIVHNEMIDSMRVEYRILSRQGEEHWIEHICRPLFGADGNNYLGRRVSNRDITERKLAEAEIRERSRREQELNQTIQTMQIDIARDLHDTVGQNISLLRMKLDHLSESANQSKVDLFSEFKVMSQVANESYDQIRGTLALLQSENSTDFSKLLSRYARQVEARAGLVIDIYSKGKPHTITRKQVRQLFYIFREAISNVEKHAQATQVLIEMNWEETALKISVKDNGTGFALDQSMHEGHYGLKFMKERVKLLEGTFSIQTARGKGTNINIFIPFQQAQAEPPLIGKG